MQELIITLDQIIYRLFFETDVTLKTKEIQSSLHYHNIFVIVTFDLFLKENFENFSLTLIRISLYDFNILFFL